MDPECRCLGLRGFGLTIHEAFRGLRGLGLNFEAFIGLIRGLGLNFEAFIGLRGFGALGVWGFYGLISRRHSWTGNFFGGGTGGHLNGSVGFM